MEDFDVIVVGAGPAGSSFCIEYLQRKPHARVLLLEGIRRANTFDPSDTAGAGHSMCSGGLGKAMLDMIGWEVPRRVIMADVNRAILRSPNRTAEITNAMVGESGPVGVVVNRKMFDDWLLREATMAGAAYRNGTRVREVHRAEGKWVVHAVNGAGPVDFNAPFLVGADGPESLVAASCLGAKPLKPEDVFLGSEVYVPTTNFPSDAILLHFQTSRIQGYHWAFAAGSVTKVGCGTTRASGVNPGGETAWWRAKLAEEYKDPGFLDKPHGSIGGRITGAPPLRRVCDARRGVAVVGEAARAVWASVGAGDASAVETGRALGKALARGRPSEYQAWWERQARPFLLRHWRIKEWLLSLPDDSLDRLIGHLTTYNPRSANARREIPRLVLFLVKNDPQLLGKALVTMTRRW